MKLNRQGEDEGDREKSFRSFFFLNDFVVVDWDWRKMMLLLENYSLKVHFHLALIIVQFSLKNEELMLIYSMHHLMPYAIHETRRDPRIRSNSFSTYEQTSHVQWERKREKEKYSMTTKAATAIRTTRNKSKFRKEREKTNRIQQITVSQSKKREREREREREI